MNIEEFNPNIVEIAERVLLGPQAEIIQKIESFNLRYNTKLKSTKTFRWSPGVNDQLQATYTKWILNWNSKRYSGVYHFFNRIDNNLYFHRSMKRVLNEINTSMSSMRQRGITFQNNTDLVVETFNNLKNKALEELESVHQIYSDQDLGLDVQVYERDSGGYYWRIEYTFTNPMMSINSLNGNGELEHLVDIKLYPFIVKFEIDFVDHINRVASNSTNSYHVAPKGRILAPSDTIYHPYIYSRHSSHKWHTVCLGDMQGDITKAIGAFDFLAASTLLIQWTSQYTVNRTHPHNKPSLSYYGMPKWLMDQDGQASYVLAFPHNSDNCGVPGAIARLTTDKERERAIINDDTCNDIECALRNTCQYYQNVINISEERADNIIFKTSNPNFIHAKAFEWMSTSDRGIRNLVNDSLNVPLNVCEHGTDLDEETCMECDWEESAAVEDMTDEERTLRWVQITMERRNR